MAAFTLSWPAVLSVGAGVLSLVLARVVWGFRGRPGAVYWTLVQVTIGVWALVYGVALTTFDPALRRAFEPVLWLARIGVVPPLFLFALAYTGRTQLLDSWLRPAVVGYWVVVFLAYVTNPLHGLAWTGFHLAPLFGAAAVDFSPQPLVYVFSGSAYVFNAIGALLILGPLVSYSRLFGRQAVTIAAVYLCPTAANVVWLLRLGPTAHLDLTPVTFLVATVGISYALFREELFEFVPATTRVANDIAIDDINAAVLTVAPNGRLVDHNDTARQSFGLDESRVLGRPFAEVIDADVPLESTEVTVSNPGGKNRQFDVDVSSITTATGDLLGHVVTFYDITAERRRQQRLAVQNRILRHNLRNGIAAVEGNAEVIEEVAADEEIAPLVENIRDTSAELLRASEKARQFDAALAEEPRTVDVQALCEAVVAELRERYSAATLHCVVETAEERESGAGVDESNVGESGAGTDESSVAEPTLGPTVQGRERLLRQVLTEVVENGVVHDESDAPHVTVRTTQTPETVEITVTDDGPGIPASELDAVRSGDEEPLSHASSLGLWIVVWGVDVFGGRVTFDTESGTGTTVSITIPRHDDAVERPRWAATGSGDRDS